MQANIVFFGKKDQGKVQDEIKNVSLAHYKCQINMETQVVLVDEQDQELGLMDKLEAHQKGLLHRAISIFVFNSKGQMLLQQRAMGKYHSEGLWTNACCSHPYPGESAADAAKRRLKEEMGLRMELGFAFSFLYKAKVSDALWEHELDWVFVGKSDENPVLNPDEAQAYAWKSAEELQRETSAHPEAFTEWFKIIWKRVFDTYVNYK